MSEFLKTIRDKRMEDDVAALPHLGRRYVIETNDQALDAMRVCLDHNMLELCPFTGVSLPQVGRNIFDDRVTDKVERTKAVEEILEAFGQRALHWFRTHPGEVMLFGYKLYGSAVDDELEVEWDAA